MFQRRASVRFSSPKPPSRFRPSPRPLYTPPAHIHTQFRCQKVNVYFLKCQTIPLKKKPSYPKSWSLNIKKKMWPYSYGEHDQGYAMPQENKLYWLCMCVSVCVPESPSERSRIGPRVCLRPNLEVGGDASHLLSFLLCRDLRLRGTLLNFF